MISEVNVSAKDKLQSLVEDLWNNGDLSREACNQLTGLALEISGQIPPLYRFRFRRQPANSEEQFKLGGSVAVDVDAETESAALLKVKVMSNDIDVLNGPKFEYDLTWIREVRR